MEIPWEELVKRIERGKLTPFLGAGISAPPLLDGATLAEELASRCNYPFRHNRDLMSIAQFWATTLDASAPKGAVEELFRGVADPDFGDPRQAHAALASLPIPVYLTTNYDDYMEKALAAARRPAQVEVCRWNSALRRRRSVLLEGGPPVDRPVVFHLHGHIDDPDSFVLTEDDYLDFMVNTRRYESDGDPSRNVLPPFVEELVSTTSLLFLGYGLRDWNLRVLLRALVESADRSSKMLSVSVQLEPEDSFIESIGRENAHEYLERYFSGLNMRVYWGTAESFLGELRDRWQAAHLTEPVASGGGFAQQ